MTVRRVFLVDDHLMLTEALASRLATDDLWVAGRCTVDDPNLFEIVRQLRPDVITIEVQSLGNTLGDVLLRLSEAWPAASVVALSADHDVASAVRAARAGVQAWVPKECAAAELAAVLRGVCKGHSWYPPEMLGPVLLALRADIRQATERSGPLDALSPRELDVLTNMADGMHSRQIAVRLSISVETVRTHIRSILTKLGVHSRLEAVQVARLAGMRPSERQADHSVGTISTLGPASERN